MQVVASLLAEREAAVKALQAPPYAAGNGGIIGSYLLRLRTDGVAKSAEMKQRIDRLAENTTALETLLDLCAARSQSAAFRKEASLFKTYAIAWRGRWDSMTEMFMSGGTFPVAEIPFPVGLPEAVQLELRATR
jgi:hypothetical protein